MFDIQAVSDECSGKTQAIFDGKVKPLDTLTELDRLAEPIANIQLTASIFDASKYCPHKLQLNSLHFTVLTSVQGVANDGIFIAASKVQPTFGDFSELRFC